MRRNPFAICLMPLILGFVVLGITASAWAWTTVNLEPVANTFISAWEQGANGNADPLLAWYNGREPIFRFDFSSLPANATLQSAVFSATFASRQGIKGGPPGSPGIAARFNVYDLAKNFDENTSNYQDWTTNPTPQAWASPGMAQFADYDVLPYESDTVLVSSTGTYSVDISSFIAILRSSGTTVANMLFTGTDYTTDTNYYGAIYSRADPVPANRPHLTLTYSMTAPQAKIAGGSSLVLTQPQWNNQPITVDGSASSRPDGSTNGLTYAWSLVATTPGSSLTLGQSLGASAVLSFNPDVPGAYVLQLTVSDPNTNEQTSVQVSVTVGLMPHPRLQINSALFNQIKAMRASNNPNWTNFYSWEQQAGPAWEAAGATAPNVPEAAYCDLDGCLPLSFIMDNLVTGSTTSLRWATEWVGSVIYNNNTNNSAGLTTIPEIYGGNQHGAGYEGGALITAVAMVYDWLYAELTPTQRGDLVNWLYNAAYYEQFENLGYTNAYHRNDGADITCGIAAAAYATLGDSPMAPTLLSWFNSRWSQTLPALSDMGTGMGEGNEYSEAPTAYHLIQAANIAYTASGQNLFLSHPFFKDRLLYNAFASYPGFNGGSYAADSYSAWPGPYVEYSPGFGDARGGTGWVQPFLRADGMILCRMFPSSPECSAWSNLYRQPVIETSGVYANNNVLLNLLFYTPPPTGLAPPSALSYVDQTSGRVYIRSDWGPDATWISIWAGPFFDAHTHLSSGAYEIFKDRHLLPDTGDYDNSGVNYGMEGQVYYERTISSNGILVGDPHETFQDLISGIGCNASGSSPTGLLVPSDNGAPVCAPNDGGERTMAPFGLEADSAEDYHAYNNIFNTGKLISFNDNGSAVSVVADITNAYDNPQYTNPGNSPKVSRVWRNWVYLRGADVLLVGDVVESTNPSFMKKDLLHALDRIEVAGSVQTVSPGEEIHTNVQDARIVVDNADSSDGSGAAGNTQVTWDLRKGNSYLLVHTAFPDSFQYRLVGGRDAAGTAHAQVYVGAGQSAAVDSWHRHTHIKDFWINDFSAGVFPNHRSLNWMPRDPAEEGYSTDWTPTFVGGFGRYRLEVEPLIPSTTDYFLNVEKPTLNSNETLPPITSVETPTTFGVSFTMSGQPYYVAFQKGTLAAPIIGTAPIFISISTPIAGATVQGTVTVTASASENTGQITQAALYDGITLIQTLPGAGPYTFQWNATNAALGQHTISVTVTDNTGNTASTSVAITVIGSPTPLPTGLQLNFPTYAPLSQVLNVSYNSSLPVDHVQWSFVPQSSANGVANSQSMASALNTGQAMSFPTQAGSMTPAQHGLALGMYDVTVQLVDAQGNILGQGSQSITFVNSGLSSLQVYPNPWRSDKHAAFGVTFDGLTVGTTIKIFTVSGREARELQTSASKIVWDLTNNSGDKVASGIYLYLVTDNQGDKVRGKLAVIK